MSYGSLAQQTKPWGSDEQPHLYMQLQVQKQALRLVLTMASAATPVAKLDANELCRRKEVVEKYLNDPLVYSEALKMGTVYQVSRLSRVIAGVFCGQL